MDSDWERNWYEFASEWPEVKLNEDRREEAATEVLLRFLKGHVFATMEQLKDWSRLPSRFLKSLTASMEESGVIVAEETPDHDVGWMRPEDTDMEEQTVPKSVFMLHKSDILVRSHISELKREFSGQEVLQYLLIDGEFKGAVLGHWRIGPHDVDDIVVHMHAKARNDRREEITNAVAWGYSPPHSNILKYDGGDIKIK